MNDLNAVRVTNVATGLWIWRIPHPTWAPPGVGDRIVTSTYVESSGEVAVLDPLAAAGKSWCREGESNPQGTKYRRILSPTRGNRKTI